MSNCLAWQRNTYLSIVSTTFDIFINVTNKVMEFYLIIFLLKKSFVFKSGNQSH